MRGQRHGTRDPEAKERLMSLQQVLAYDKLRVAVERSKGSDYGYRAGRRAFWNRRLDVGIGLHRKRRFHTVEGDTGRSSQVVTQDEDALADHGCGFHERAEAVREFEDRAIATGTGSVASGSLDAAVGALKKRTIKWS
jgi:hypothetical protein